MPHLTSHLSPLTFNTFTHNRTNTDEDYKPGDDSGDMEFSKSKPALSWLEKVAFGLPHLATAAMFLPTAIHINKFFADTLMVPPGHLAIGTYSSSLPSSFFPLRFGFLSPFLDCFL